MARFKVLILAGAPDSSALDWDPSVLLSALQPPIARFARLGPPLSSSSPRPAPSTGQQHAAWRSLPLERQRLHTGLTQEYTLALSLSQDPGSDSDFLTTTAGLSFLTADGSQADDETTRFYEQSLATHEQVASSQSDPGDDTTTEETTSFPGDDTTTADADADTTKQPLCPLTTRHHQHTSLRDLPTATSLLAAHPATVTVNLIAGIISLTPARTVQTRQGRTSTLAEMLVGDETRSGFAITFWLPGGGVEGPLAGLRARDVVLLRNVALAVFMGRVYGSSLRGDTTRVHLLHRRRLGRGDEGGYYGVRDLARARARARGGGGEGQGQVEKTGRVWEWVLNFVGTGNGGGGGGGGGVGDGDGREKKRRRPAVRSWDVPPPDTQ